MADRENACDGLFFGAACILGMLLAAVVFGVYYDGP